MPAKVFVIPMLLGSLSLLSGCAGHTDSKISSTNEQVFQDTLSDGTPGPKMVVLPTGTFWMGAPRSKLNVDAYGGYNEQQHQVRLTKPLAIGQTEVTFEQYDRFCAATGLEKPNDEGWGRGQRPVINVSWREANAYAAWLSQQTGHSYRLPTEAEWEYAARAGTTTAYWWGDEVGRNRANCGECGSRWDHQQTAPVGSFPANPWKLYDTAGNVAEWTCSEVNTRQYDGQETQCGETNEYGFIASGGAGNPAVRGGGWFSGPNELRSAARSWKDPAYHVNHIGFRLVRAL